MGAREVMIANPVKAIYARILAQYMRLHPRAAYHIINTALNYGRLPIPGKTGGTYRSITIRRHQTTIVIRRERHCCTMMTWGPGGIQGQGTYKTTDFADIITRTRDTLNRQRIIDTNWRTVT